MRGRLVVVAGLASCLMSALPVWAGGVIVGSPNAVTTQTPNVITRDLGTRQPGEPPVRPTRYYCVIKPPPSEHDVAFYSCPKPPGRVGETCRCDNAVGSGRLRAY
ncbi:hypothetical protein NAC44_19590 [Allorhizobium sp. BGMRC 0089]|uniref:hypothetical protein n=1 Tax=Allorhizobium sonneratiae TaxID=2934936 RepID=UPI00203463BA|nr:hypothetical protein [Allorhizobium sonneratiae]MCM2294535.1 hypothetical protein [Allorhizobium sonneratiae]